MDNKDLIVRRATRSATQRDGLSGIPTGRMNKSGMIVIDDTGESMMTLRAACEALWKIPKGTMSLMLSRTDFFDAFKVRINLYGDHKKGHIMWGIKRTSINKALGMIEKNGVSYLRELFAKMIAGCSYEQAKLHAIEKRNLKNLTITEYRKHYERVSKGSHEARRRTLERAGYKCEICGWQYAPQSGIALTAHHILEVKNGGDNSDENLICLCERCHRIVHQTTDYSRDDLRVIKNTAANRL